MKLAGVLTALMAATKLTPSGRSGLAQAAPVSPFQTFTSPSQGDQYDIIISLKDHLAKSVFDQRKLLYLKDPQIDSVTSELVEARTLRRNPEMDLDTQVEQLSNFIYVCFVSDQEQELVQHFTPNIEHLLRQSPQVDQAALGKSISMVRIGFKLAYSEWFNAYFQERFMDFLRPKVRQKLESPS
jgi:hypothetical protein